MKSRKRTWEPVRGCIDKNLKQALIELYRACKKREAYKRRKALRLADRRAA